MTELMTQYQPSRPEGRFIEIDVTDPDGHRAVGAEVAFQVNGVFAGMLTVGSSRSGPITIEISNPLAVVDIRAELLGQVHAAVVAPGDDSRLTFVFESVPRFAAEVQSRATCPDGTSGSPCVICFADGESWRMCG